MKVIVVDYELDANFEDKQSGHADVEQYGPYDSDNEAIFAAKNRWAHLGVAISQRIHNELCENDGNPVCRLEYQ